MTLAKQKPRPKSTIHRKRSGQHHRQSRHYLKSYWPYLPVFAILGMGIGINTWLSRPQPKVLAYTTNVSSQAILADTNSQRLQHHEAALHPNQKLIAAAQAKANDMAQRNYWSHSTPDGLQPGSFLDKAGYQYTAAGENLAYGFGTSTDVVTALMRSNEHRANILNAQYKDIGIATTEANNYQGQGPVTIIVALYGTPFDAKIVNAALPVLHLDSQAQTVSRLQLATSINWLEFAVTMLCGATIAIYFMRHSFAWHKVLVRGEEFTVKHPLFDIFLVATFTLGFLLSHVAGSIL